MIVSFCEKNISAPLKRFLMKGFRSDFMTSIENKRDSSHRFLSSYLMLVFTMPCHVFLEEVEVCLLYSHEERHWESMTLGFGPKNLMKTTTKRRTLCGGILMFFVYRDVLSM